MIAALLSALGLALTALALWLFTDGMALWWRQRRVLRAQRPLRLRVVSRHDWDAEHFSVLLRAERRGWKRLPPFEPGQYLTLLAALPGARRPARRSYSLAAWQTRPHEYELGIKREADGRVSSWLHQALQAGGHIQALRPRGDFVLHAPQPDEEVVLIGGGIGITPMRAMLHAIQADATRSRVRVHLWHSVRHSAALAWREEFEPLAQAQAQFHYHPRVTRPDPHEPAAPRLDAAQLLAVLRHPHAAHFYLCASDSMMQALIADLEIHGIARERIHWESFGAAGASGDTQGYRVALDAAPAFTLCGEPSLLHALEEQGIELPADCRAGTCGECRLRLRSGEVRWIATPGLTLPANEILACCTLPMSDLQLEARRVAGG